jgi:hypothetical protein
MLTTVMRWNGRQWMVELRTDGQLLATLSLDDWMALPATQFAIEDAVRIARHADLVAAPPVLQHQN